jgi:hypothetical protein
MYIHSKKRVCLFIATAVMLFFSATLNSQVSLVTIVTPPYTSNFSQYAEKVKITAISPVSGELRLKMNIKGDNGITIQTLETGSVSISANEPFQVPEDYLYAFFNVGSLRISGISPTELSDKGFPAGTYQVCFNATVSGSTTVTGQSCSAMFRIALAQPAMIIQPLCGSEQFKGGIQNILFSWAPSPGAPRWTQYTLRIVEIRDSLLAPAQALRSGTRPPFFEEEVSGISYLYSPKDPPLEKGCRYAFEIIASDRETNTRFANGGRSEMCYFRYGKEDKDFPGINPALAVVTVPKKKKANPILSQKEPFAGTFFCPANISGTLYYQYAGTNLPASISQDKEVDLSKQPQNNLNNANMNVKGGTKTVQYGGQNLVFNKVSGNNFNVAKTGTVNNVSNQIANMNLYNTDLRDPAKSFPLANMPVSLVVKYMVFDNSVGKMKMLSAYDINSSIPAKYIKIQPDQVMASGYTDAAGDFDFTFLLKDSLGLVASNISFYTGSGEFKTNYKGNLYRVLRLIVGSKHYCSPAQDIIVQPGETESYEDLYALVRNYGLTVSTKIDASTQNSLDGPFEGLDVYILRKNDIADVPDDEGYPVPAAKSIPDLPGFTVIASKKSTADGTAKFMHLVKNLNGYDKYYIYVNSASSPVFAYNSAVKEYSNTVNNEGTNILVVPENAVYNNEYVYDGSYKVSLDLIALPPVIYGTVALSAGTGTAENNGLLAEGAGVSLIRVGGYMNIIQLMTKTDSEGKFSIPISSIDGVAKYNVGASMNGYKSDRVPVNNAEPLKNGRKYEVKKMFLQTTAVLSGKIIDKEAGTGVKCHVSVQGGLSVFSSDPALTSIGVSSNFATLETADITHIKEMTLALNLPQMNTVPAVFIPSISEKARINTMSLAQAKNKPLNSVSAVANAVTLGPSYFALPAPSGDQIIIIDPDNKVDYFGDTITVSLSEGNNTGVIKIARKIHRIRLTVKVAVSGQNKLINPSLSPGNAKVANTGNIAGNPSLNSNKTPNTTILQADKKNNNPTINQTNKQVNIKNNNQLVNNTAPGFIENANFNLVANAKVRIAGRPEYVLTDDQGIALLEFDGSDNFSIEVLPPDNRDLESAAAQFEGISASKDYRDLSMSLKPAAHIAGYVTLNGQGVAGATVKLNYPGKQIETTTENDGSYTLKKVPIESNLDFEATKDKYIGSTQTLSVTSEGKEGVNFELTQFTDIDYSRMLGFPITLTKPVEKEGGKTYIYGYFNAPPPNGQIDMGDDKQKLTFTKLEITKGSVTGGNGLPYPVPAAQDFKVNENTAALTLNGTFTGTLESDNSGITIAKGGNDNSGHIKGKVSINTDISFQTNSVSFSAEKLYVMATSSDQAPKTFNVFSADGTKPFGDNGAIPLFNQNGKNILYTLYGFNAEAKSNGSRIEGAKVKLNTILHTNLQNTGTADLAVQLGDVELTTQDVIPISKTAAITMPLEKWTLKATKWSLNNNGFKLTEGEVVTHMASVAFKNMEVEPQQLKYGTFDLQTMNIRGIATLHITGNASLIYQAGHWNLAIVPSGSSCGYIEPLPGMPANQNIMVSSVYLKSDKSGTFSVESNPFRLYGIADFNPTSLNVYDNRIEFPGTVNLNIPDVPDHDALITYRKPGSEVIFSFHPFTFDFNTKGVDLVFSIDENSFTSSGLTAKGTLSEPNKYSVNVQLNHNSSKTEIVDIPGQTFPIDKAGNRKLSNFDGEMHVGSDQWSNFIFSGDLTGANGVAGKLTFVVNGDITAEGQAVQMDKISTPFGDLKLTYDFDKGRLIGILEIEQELAGTGYIKGSAESVVDADGWYFCAGGMITIKNNPYFKNMSTAMLFGDYPSLNDPFITQTFAEFSYTHALPSAFQGQIKGFYIDGAATFPVPYVPDIDIDLVVVSGRASVSVGGNFSLGLNFADEGTTIYTGAAVFVNAVIGIGGSVGIACAGASFGVNVEVAQQGELKSNGNWYLEGTSTLTLTGSAYAGVGCCDSDCDGYYVCPCVSDSWSGGVSLQFLAHMGSDDNYFKINW